MIDVSDAEGLVGNSDDGEDKVSKGSVYGSSWDTSGVGVDLYQGSLDCIKSGGHFGRMHCKDLS